ncbi:uncharacterized protein LOC144435197 [Glandiceps talaboti]
MDEDALTRTMTAADTYIEEPKICGHKIKTKLCAFFGIGIFCIVAGAIMMIVGIVGHEGHLIGILGTLVVVMGIIALSFSLSMFCCSRKTKGKKYQSGTPIVKRPMQNKDFRKLTEQAEPMMTVSIVNESAMDKGHGEPDEDEEEDETNHIMGTREDEPLTAITPSSSTTSKRTSSSEHTDDRRTSKMSASSVTAGPQLA